MIKMLPFFLLCCQKNTHDQVTVFEYKNEKIPDSPLKRFEKHALKFKPHVVKTENMTVLIPVQGVEHSLNVSFHMMENTVKEDINHLVLASTIILEETVSKTFQKLGRGHEVDLEVCFSNIDKIELYHTKCETMNSEVTKEFLDKDYAVKGSTVIAGLTQSDRSTETFTVSYCYDSALRRSTNISYDNDTHFREVTLAHEMVHVWLEACKPGAQFFYTKEYELAAWEFHKSYEPTAKKLHVDY
jgi:hypothetical protein